MLEINHDYTPYTKQEKMDWIERICYYLSSGNPSLLPNGVTWFGMRHHTEDCAMGNPPRGWDNERKIDNE
jgi:hypothetical protein